MCGVVPDPRGEGEISRHFSLLSLIYACKELIRDNKPTQLWEIPCTLRIVSRRTAKYIPSRQTDLRLWTQVQTDPTPLD